MLLTCILWNMGSQRDRRTYWKNSFAISQRAKDALLLSFIFLPYYSTCRSCSTSEWTNWTHFSDQSGYNLSTRYRAPSNSRIDCNRNTSECCYEVNMTDSNVVVTGRASDLSLLGRTLSCSPRGRIHRNEKGRKVCKCPRQYTGIFCEINIGECSREPCVNGGTCFENESGYSCACKPGFEGQHCEETASTDKTSDREEEKEMEKKKQEENRLLTIYVAPLLVAAALFLALLVGWYAKKGLNTLYQKARNTWFYTGRRKADGRPGARKSLTPEERLKLQDLRMTNNMQVLRLMRPLSPDMHSDSHSEPTEIITLSRTKSATLDPEDEKGVTLSIGRDTAGSKDEDQPATDSKSLSLVDR